MHDNKTPSNTHSDQILDVLDEFLALYRTNLVDWASTVLEKALHLQSMKQTQSNNERVLRVLDTLHRSFPYDLQLNWCFSLLDCKPVQANVKMKVLIFFFYLHKSNICTGCMFKYIRKLTFQDHKISLQ